MNKLVIRYDDRIKSFNLNKVDYDVNKDPDGYVRLHVHDKETGEPLLSLSLNRRSRVSIEIQ